MLGQNAAPPASQPAPVLGQLKFAAERIGASAERIQWFVNRFHGDAPATDKAQSAGNVVQDTYRNDIDSLFRQLDRLESIVSQLDTIG